MSTNRLLILVLLVVAGFVAIVIRLANIQLLHNDEYKYYAQRQQTSIEKIHAERGLIFDADSLLLVYNRNDVNFYVDLLMAKEKDIEKISTVFSKEFGHPIDYYKNLLSSDKKIVYIERKVNPAKAINLKSLKINGLNFEESPTRIFHYKNFASHLLGYTNINNVGVDGIEKSFEEQLKGKDGNRVILKDAKGNMITVLEKSFVSATAGNNIFLTIKKDFQTVLEEELRNGLITNGASSAMGIIMNPNTGEILSFANIEDFDPNCYFSFNDTIRRNKILVDTYEPGSTLKAFSLSALIDKNLCNENEFIDVENGKYKFKKIVIKDAHPSDKLSVKEVFTKSSNIGMSKLSQRIDKESLYLYYRNFGFGNYTNINLPGEAKGNLKIPSKWTDYTKSSLSFGYEISTTPIQIISAYSAIINGGILYQPQVVKKIVKDDGTVFYNFKPIFVRRVINENTSYRMKKLLHLAVEEGTGKKAKLNNISVGGKTGTTKKLFKGEYSSSYYASFVGFFPVENPQYICLIVINTPIAKSYYGGDVSAPIFKNIAERIIKIDQSFNSYQNYFKQLNNEKNINTIFASNVNSSIKSVNENKINYPTSEDLKNTDELRMPDLRGKSIRSAIKILTKLKLKYVITGSGKVSYQSIEPNSKIFIGMKCNINGESNSLVGTVLY